MLDLLQLPSDEIIKPLLICPIGDLGNDRWLGMKLLDERIAACSLAKDEFSFLGCHRGVAVGKMTIDTRRILRRKWYEFLMAVLGQPKKIMTIAKHEKLAT